MKLTILLAVLVTTLVGCGSTQQSAKPMRDDPYYAPVIPEAPSREIVPDGSLFTAAYSNSLYSDTKARRIGDIITVSLQENTSASKSAKSEYGKENSVTVNPMTISGKQATFNNQAFSLGLDSETDFKGDSKADQSNSLNGQISVHITQILPNGNLIVKGEKWLTLNTGDEYIRLTGIVRPADVASDNIVSSTRVANARIEYSGTGSFANASKQGWLSQFFYSTWWPF